MAVPDRPQTHYAEFARALQAKNVVRAAEILVDHGAFSHGVNCAITLITEFIETNTSPTKGVGKDSFPNAIERLKQQPERQQSRVPSSAFANRRGK